MADQLSALEKNGAVWKYEGSQSITPSLVADKESTIEFEEFYRLLCTALDESAVDWNPYE